MDFIAMLTEGHYDAPDEKPQEPAPQLIPEVWQDKPADSSRAWAAVVAMCRGGA